jgi:hypothetical protein
VADKDKYDLYLPIAEKIIASIEYIPIQSTDNSEEEEGDSSDSEKKDNNSDSKDEDDDSKDEDEDKEESEDEDKDDCDDSYPDVCIPSPPPDLDCGEISQEDFKVKGSDPHRFDGDEDGRGCEED